MWQKAVGDILGVVGEGAKVEVAARMRKLENKQRPDHQETYVLERHWTGS